MTRLDTISLKKTGEMADLLARRHIRHLPANQSAMPNPSFHRTLRIEPRRPMNSNASAFFASQQFTQHSIMSVLENTSSAQATFGSGFRFRLS